MTTLNDGAEARTHNRYWISPCGLPVQRVWTHTWNAMDIDALTTDGIVDDYHSEDTDAPELLNVDGGPYLVQDVDGGDWLSSLCYLTEIPRDALLDDIQLPGWDDETIALANRARMLSETLRHIQMLRDGLPREYTDGTTMTVLDAVVTKRVKEDVERTNRKIATYRATFNEPARIEEDDPCLTARRSTAP